MNLARIAMLLREIAAELEKGGGAPKKTRRAYAIDPSVVRDPVAEELARLALRRKGIRVREAAPLTPEQRAEVDRRKGELLGKGAQPGRRKRST